MDYKTLKNVSPQLHYIATEPTPPTKPVLVLPAPESLKNTVKQEFVWMEVVGLTEKVYSNISVTWSVGPPCSTEEGPAIQSERRIFAAPPLK